ncbi:MAG: ABC transporter permease [Candidatus Hermodarchaeota archaeon]
MNNTVTPALTLRSAVQKIKNTLSHPYARFLQRKGAFYLIILFISITLIFLIPRLMPGDPATRITPPLRPPETPEDYAARIAQFQEYYGLDKPLHEQYINFWINLFQLNLGPTFSYPNDSTIEILIPALLFTFSLVVPVVLISFFLGNWIGARSAYLKGKADKIVYYFSLLAQSAPFYWLALIFFWIFVFQLKIFNYGFAPAGLPATLSIEYFLVVARYYVLPFSILLIGFTGGWATGMRSMTLYEMESEYLIYSEQLGFRKTSLRKYAQRNAILPQFTGLNIRLSEAIGATLVLEWVFGWPGIGDLLLTSALAQDFPLLMGTSLIVIIVIIGGNFLVDAVYGYIDPRIKTGSRSE